MYYLILLIELLTLFFLSKLLTRSLSFFLQLLRFNQSWTIVIIAIIFLPGTVIHELSHWLMAKLLFVPTGKISLFPQLQGNMLKMGSVAVARTDPIRNLLIGVAPFLAGITILLLSLSFFLPRLQSFNYAIVGLFIYILFVLTNSMFSSKKDLEGAGLFILLFIAVIAVFFFFGQQQFLSLVQQITKLFPVSSLLSAITYLSIPLLLDILIILILKLCTYLIKH